MSREEKPTQGKKLIMMSRSECAVLMAFAISEQANIGALGLMLDALFGLREKQDTHETP